MPKRHIPVGDLATDVEEIIRDLGEHNGPITITVDGKPKAVLQDFKSYDDQQNALALLKVLAMGGAGGPSGQSHADR